MKTFPVHFWTSGCHHSRCRSPERETFLFFSVFNMLLSAAVFVSAWSWWFTCFLFFKCVTCTKYQQSAAQNLTGQQICAAAAAVMTSRHCALFSTTTSAVFSSCRTQVWKDACGQEDSLKFGPPPPLIVQQRQHKFLSKSKCPLVAGGPCPSFWDFTLLKRNK